MKTTKTKTKTKTKALWIVLAAVLGVALPARAQDADVTPERIERALARYRGEPSVGRLVRAAETYRTASPGRIHDAMNRARATGWLPTTRASVRRGQTVDLRGLGGGTVDTITNVSTDDALTFEASMTFRFDRVVFATEERGLLRELRATEDARAAIAELVVRLYYERRRLQLEQDLARRVDLARTLRVLEIEALLDALTGGAFSRLRARED